MILKLFLEGAVVEHGVGAGGLFGEGLACELCMLVRGCMDMTKTSIGKEVYRSFIGHGERVRSIQRMDINDISAW